MINKKRDKQLNIDIKMRPCLGPLCGGRLFLSSWNGHRLCSRCKTSVDRSSAGVMDEEVEIHIND